MYVNMRGEGINEALIPFDKVRRQVSIDASCGVRYNRNNNNESAAVLLLDSVKPDGWEETTLEKAKSQGLTPCQKCVLH